MRYSISGMVMTMLVAVLEGCEPSCDFMYAPGGATVELEADAWPAGTYTVEVLGEACDLVLPAPDDGTTNYCDSGVLTVHPTEDAQGLRDFRIMMDPPETFEVVISLDGVEFHRSVVAPVYEQGEPNGPGCGEASYGEATLAVDPV